MINEEIKREQSDHIPKINKKPSFLHPFHILDNNYGILRKILFNYLAHDSVFKIYDILSNILN